MKALLSLPQQWPGRGLVLPALALIAGLPGAVLAKEPRASCLPGAYAGNQAELASALSLHADGRYDFAMVYGALDEESHGQWEEVGGRVYLTSDGYSPPAIMAAGEEALAGGELRVLLDVPGSLSRQYFDVEVQREDGSLMSSQMHEEGLSLPPEPGNRPIAVRVFLPMMELTSEFRRLASPTGSQVRFRFDPNDMGMVSFTRQPVEVAGPELLLERHGRQLRLRRGEGGCR